MNNTIQIFKSEQFGEIRTAGTAENPMFCLSDVCKAVGITNARNVKNRLEEDDVHLVDTIDSLGRTQQVIFVTESGLYDVIIRSDSEQAKPFRKWVTSEVLPSIRKTGGYIATTGQMTDEEIMARALQIGQKTIERQQERIRSLEADNMSQQVAIEQKDAVIELQDEELKKQAPKVNYYDMTMQSQNTMTTTQIAKSVGLEVHMLTQKLKDAGIIYRQSGMWMLRSPYTSWGLHSVRTQTFTRSDGSINTNQYTVWREKGKRFIVALMENQWNPRKAIKAITSADYAIT